RVPVLLTRAHRAERRTHQARAHRVAATARSQQALTPLAVPLLLKPRTAAARISRTWPASSMCSPTSSGGPTI
ncbi:MAG TPA: hypothetical protein VIJ23_16695, partial [Mycobacterium sp.]